MGMSEPSTPRTMGTHSLLSVAILVVWMMALCVLMGMRIEKYMSESRKVITTESVQRFDNDRSAVMKKKLLDEAFIELEIAREKRKQKSNRPNATTLPDSPNPALTINAPTKPHKERFVAKR
eukprot:TRINITY_DN21088_c0_g1_i1.p1 TRINITY_DN21088_c0_g1~~TRINITY_DN21088_c0_g1_i1.p1  ORF type:complete len:122 (+),score=18.45 TRINITY_DN21088_c0_g1_i1:38-403(+)